MSGKVKVNLTMDRKVVEKAKKIGLNISKVSENALKELIRRIESPNAQKNAQDKDVAGPRGFEPRVSGSAGQRPNPG